MRAILVVPQRPKELCQNRHRDLSGERPGVRYEGFLEDIMVYCNNGHKAILASGMICSFTPDQEPFEDGKREDCGFPEIEVDVSVGIHWCPKCGAMNAWIEDPINGGPSFTRGTNS